MRAFSASGLTVTAFTSSRTGPMSTYIAPEDGDRFD